MKNLFLTGVVILLSLTLFAQSRFIVQNGTAQVYNDITEAFEATVAGDTVYLPGGVFTLSSEQQTQNKQLTIFGAGYNPDSTQATYHTYLTHGMTFQGACDGSYITGVYFDGNLTFGDDADDATDIILERCRFNNVYLRVMSSDSVDTNFELNECILSAIVGNNVKNATIQNNIVFNQVYNIHNSTFSHNIFTNRFDASQSYYPDRRVFENLDQCYVVDNIFSNPTGNSNLCSYMTNSVFSHNMFRVTLSFPINTNTGHDNVFGVGSDVMFVNVPSDDSFDWDYDWHLTIGCPGIGAATGGDDIGLYGGPHFWKDGALPFNPHIRSAVVPEQTTDGTLPVEISVGAQNN